MGYLFDPDVLRDCAARGIGLPLEEAFDAITAALAEHYPGHIDTGPRDWIYSCAGGAKGMMTLLHGSVREYVILFGSDVGTHGHSGIYRSEVDDWSSQGPGGARRGSGRSGKSTSRAARPIAGGGR